MTENRTVEQQEDQGFDTEHWPTEIRYLSAEKKLVVTFDSGETFRYPAEFLRVESPSAEVQGHGPGQKQIVSKRRHVGIMEVVPVGNYAVRIKFDDLHDSGIFSWQYLYRLGRDQDRLWQTYLDNLAAKGLSRDP
jgi:DUF971 family protein